MEAKRKIRYTAPVMTAVEVKAQSIICESKELMIWSISAPSYISPTEEWSRSDYGSANEI